MNMIELKRKDGRRFLLDFDSGWQITENVAYGKPAQWCNDKLGMNLDCVDSYDEIRDRVANKLLRKDSPIV